MSHTYADIHINAGYDIAASLSLVSFFWASLLSCTQVDYYFIFVFSHQIRISDNSMNATEAAAPPQPDPAYLQMLYMLSLAKLQNDRRSVEIAWGYAIAPLGIIMSVLSLVVFIKMSKSKLDTALSFYLPAVAVFDCLKLLVGVISVLWKEGSSVKTIAVCRGLHLLMDAFGLTSFLLVLAACVDRAIVLTRPDKGETLSHKKRAILATCIIFTACFGLDLCNLWMRIADQTGKNCQYDPRESKLIKGFMAVIMLIMVVSFVLVIASCSIIIYKTVNQRQKVKTSTGR